MHPETPFDPRKKIMKIPEQRRHQIGQYIESRDEPWKFYGRKVLITNRGKVVAHAEWDESHENLVVRKIRRPNNTKLSVGQVLFGRGSCKFESIPVPRELPELHTEGVLLFRTHAYDSSKAVRPDPFWNAYEGWSLIPKLINGRDGLDTLLIEYPEIRDHGHTELNPDGADTSTWMMADQRAVDAYVCGRSEEEPKLIPFKLPCQEDIVSYRPVIGMTGNFECFSLYFVNRWTVYIPRKSSL
jgi:hypothetical protein